MKIGKSAVTKAQAAIAVVIIVVAIAAGAYFYTSTGVPGATTTAQQEVNIKIGLLVDLSGPLTTYGQDIRDATTIAMENVNSYFMNQSKPYRVQLFVEDTQVNPKIALDKVQDLYGKGVTMMVGPMGSGEVKQMAEYVTSNKLIIVSPSSTAAVGLLGITKPEEKK